MGYDIFESISQGKYGENASQVGRMEEVTDFLYRSCANHEKKHGARNSYGGSLYSEQSYVEQYAETHNCWYSIDDVFDLGTPGPSGSENDTYVDKEGGIVYKTNNLIHTGSYYKLFKRLLIHNELFPQTAYVLVGFTGYKGRTVYPLLAQRYIENAVSAEQSEIEQYMLSLGFLKIDDWTYEAPNIVISDLKPKNVLKDVDGDLYVIDAEIKKKPTINERRYGQDTRLL